MASLCDDQSCLLTERRPDRIQKSWLHGEEEIQVTSLSSVNLH